MRILMITDFYWPFLGGVEQHVRSLSHALAKRGHQVAVATLSHGNLPEFEMDGPVRVYRLRSTTQRVPWLFKNPGRTWAPPFPDPGITRALRAVLEREAPQIVHGHDWLARSFLPLKAGSKARLVVSLHYYTQSCAKKSLMVADKPCSGPGLLKCLRCAALHYGAPKGIPITLTNWITSAAERAAVDMFIPVSQATAVGNGLTRRDRYQVIPNFLPDSRQSTIDITPYLDQLPDSPFLMFVGDLRRDKGLEVLLAAYEGLKAAPPLVLIGKIWSETPLDFPNDVHILQNWPNEAVLEAWKRSLIAIVPSLWPEPFGIVVIEALASGRPVIASRTGGIPEIFQGCDAGILVPPGDPVALQSAVEALLNNPARRAQMSSAAARQARLFAAGAVVPRIEQMYQELLQSNPEAHEPATPGEHYYQQL